MNISQVRKCQKAKLNDKRYYLSDSIASLPIGHSYLVECKKHKKDSELKIQNHFLSNNYNLQELEIKAISRNKRIWVLRAILLHSVPY